MLSLVISLLLPLHSGASSPGPAEPAVKLISLCGAYDPVSRALAIPQRGGTVILERGSPAPEEPGRFCFQGPALSTGSRAAPSWVFRAQRYLPAPEVVNFPVLICAAVEKDFSTAWNGDRLFFKGPFPEKEARFGWCGDGLALPSRIRNGFYFENSRFRELPDPYQRSGMSIGNQ